MFEQQSEHLSAFIDAELSDREISQMVDMLLNDSGFKQHYVRTQLTNDYLHGPVDILIDSKDMRNTIALAVDELENYSSGGLLEKYSLDNLQTAKIEDVTHYSWWHTFFNKSSENRLLSGMSVAASVMLVTLFLLQYVDSPLGKERKILDISTIDVNTLETNEDKYEKTIASPSLIQNPSLPAYFISTNNESSTQQLKQQYQWIEAAPELSKQVRDYINEHEQRRLPYNLQPKIRTATYKISE
jgi:negative regulator of sigma E activity